MTERGFAIEVVRQLRQAGFDAYWAGGCVRDELLGEVPADYDVATSARPEEVIRLFRRTVEVGVSFGVVEVIGPRGANGAFLKIQVATFRSDGEYSDGRRPTSVTFSSPQEDAQRRDFTINGMFFDPLQNQVLDYVGGRADLSAKILRIGDPVARFTEDKLRLLRAVRMASRFRMTMDLATSAAIQQMAKQIQVVSAERIAEELRKMLAHPHRADGMRLMDELGLIEPIIPELLEMKDLPQGLPAAPTGDLWAHVMKVLETLQGSAWPRSVPVSFTLAFGALLHDVGKRRTVGRAAEKYTFHGHEHVGKRMAVTINKRLKLSNQERERIEWLVEKHQYLCEAPQMRVSKLKQILVHPGIGELLALHRADSIATGRSTAHVDYCEKMLRELPPELLNPVPLITGDDLTARGLAPGPLFKPLLDTVRDAQLEGLIQTSEQAFQMVDDWLSKNGPNLEVKDPFSTPE